MDPVASEFPPEAPTPIAHPVVAPRRRFAWGSFFFGVGAGILLCILVAVAGIAVLISAARHLNDDDAFTASGAMLPAPQLPGTGQLSFYGTIEPTWTLQTLDGDTMTAEGLRGKVLFVNFWATWCAPCRAELPSIQRLHERLKDARVVFLLVSDEDLPTIRTFVQKKPWSFEPYHGGRPPAIFQTTGIPATFVVDPTGMVVYRHVGGARWDDDTVVAFLRSLS